MTDLTNRMRTCAAWIIEHDSRAGGPSKVLANVTLDAADLLIEASNIIEAFAQPQYPPGVPMEIIEPSHTPIPPTIDRTPSGTWIAIGDTLPAARLRSPHTCPKCDSRANKRVRWDGDRLMLICSVCAETWEFER